ncbi:hypothetical protein EZMO1_4917 [Endozoicomonas montiporae CL-33]|nr:hypothetical protein [Endozoicomonas montiporae]AMO58804.1 hypothetical protein EZMO1_4917 [Endozoicomonas montiporae CL-33]
MLASFEQFLIGSPDWLVLLTLISAILPLTILPVTVLGLFSAKSCNKPRAYLRLMYLMLPWIPFAALAGAFIMSLSNLLLGMVIGLIFVVVRLYFVFMNSASNGLNAAAAAS